MNNAATIEKLHLLKLHGMQRAFRALSPDEMLAHLVDLEWEDRHSRKATRLIRAAAFRCRAVLAELDFTVSRGIDRASLARLADCSWVKAGKTVLVTGPCGVGKSFLIQARGSQACLLGYRTLYFNCGKLFQLLKEKRADGGYRRFVGRSSSAGESHPHALTEPHVSLSTHTALIAQPSARDPKRFRFTQRLLPFS